MHDRHCVLNVLCGAGRGGEEEDAKIAISGSRGLTPRLFLCTQEPGLAASGLSGQWNNLKAGLKIKIVQYVNIFF